jgi:large conductance mechanosensitive channel
MLKGFKDFLLRGNIVDLAVAVVIGTAFTALVASFTANLINPLIARAGGADVGGGLGIQLGEDGNADTFLNIGDFITAIVTFLITAAVVYFLVVVPMKTIMERLKRPEDAVVEEVDEQTALLREIRDALVATRPSSGGEHAGGTPTV